MDVPFELLVFLRQLLTPPFVINNLFLIFIVVFTHNFLQSIVLVFKFLDSSLIGDGKLVLLVLKLMYEAFQFVVFVTEGEVVVLLFEN